MATAFYVASRSVLTPTTARTVEPALDYLADARRELTAMLPEASDANMPLPVEESWPRRLWLALLRFLLRLLPEGGTPA